MSITTGGYAPEGAVEPDAIEDLGLEAAIEHAYTLGFNDAKTGKGYDAKQVEWTLWGEYRKGYEAGQRVAGRVVRHA